MVALGLLWLLDGFLQFQPYMFTPGFFTGILGMANMGLPGPVSGADYHVASLLGAHPAVWNSVFASIQVLLGAGMLWPRSARAALAVSIPWALGVWVVGEGFGALFMGGTSLLTGAPGAALIYALAAVVLWPGGAAHDRYPAHPGHDRYPAHDRYPGHDRLRAGFAVGSWATIWVAGACLEFSGTNHAAGVPAAQIKDTATGQPWVMRAVNQGLAGRLDGRGVAFATVLGLCGAAIGLGALVARTRSAALVGGIVVAAFIGLVGQDLGGLFSGSATDPGSGPPLIIWALSVGVATGALRSTPGHSTSAVTRSSPVPMSSTVTHSKVRHA